MIEMARNIARGAAFQAITERELLMETTISTTDATPTDVLALDVEDYSAGIMEVWVTGVDNAGNAITGAKILRYKRLDTVLTLGTATDTLALQADIAGSFSVAAVSTQIVVSVTGVAATGINWKVKYRIINVINDTAP